MKKLLVGALAAAFLPSAANAAVIVSENFENGSGAFTLSGNAVLATGATYTPCCGTPSDTSNTFVAFGGGNLPSGLASTSFNTVLGATYTVKFDYAALGGGSEPLTFTVAGQSFTFNPVADNAIVFAPGTFTFTGTGGSSSLVVTSGGFDNVDAIVDNISIAGAVPEPTTWALFILGFALTGGALRRSKKTRVALQFV